jgi:hypothetical protein
MDIICNNKIIPRSKVARHHRVDGVRATGVPAEDVILRNEPRVGLCGMRGLVINTRDSAKRTRCGL